MAVKQANANVIIAADEVVKSRRGRTAETDQGLLDFLGTIPDGSFGVVGQFGPQESKEGRSKVAAQIRKHWAMLGRGKPQINWHPTTNLPQVGAKVS